MGKFNKFFLIEPHEMSRYGFISQDLEEHSEALDLSFSGGQHGDIWHLPDRACVEREVSPRVGKQEKLAYCIILANIS